jgi:hypothetical protein
VETTSERKTFVIKVQRNEPTPFEIAKRYYSIVSAVGDFNWTEREIQLIAFTSIKGNISYRDVKKEFCETYSSSFATINNIVSKLKQKKILIKDGSKVRVHPSIRQDFNNNIVIVTSLLHI